MILYGILPSDVDVRRFSRYGINTLINAPVGRSEALSVTRSTCLLLLHELRRYVRIPLVIEVSMESPSGKFSGSTREISGGGMSVELAGQASLLDTVRLSFILPERPPVSIGAKVCWRKDSIVGFQFQDSDLGRQAVRGWINSFLGLD